MPRLVSCRGRAGVYFSLALLSVFLLPAVGIAQGNGRASTGTGGIHSIQGYIFFPSGRRAEGTIIVKLQSYNAGEITVLPDSSGEFIFTQLAPGNYTVVVQAGDDYEIARENVYFDSDVNLSRTGGGRIPQSPQRQTVMVHLQLKPSVAHTNPGVLDAALAQVPEKARKLYERGLDQSRAGDAVRAVDSLKEAVALYPQFPLALNELGVQYLKLGQTANAIETLRSAIKLSPDAFSPKLNLGIALLEARDYEEAEGLLRGALKLNTSLPTGHMYLGICLARLNDYNAAEKELLVAVKNSGNQLGMAQYYLGGIYWKRNDYPRAVEALEAYLKLTPNAQDADRVRATIRDLRSRMP
jgi:tetratricopeptide (TPR) repeat protein